MSDVILQLEKVEKRFGNTDVLNGIDLTVYRGEFVTLLGPSGCGKTTTLRIISGLESPDGGKVLIEGADVTELPPNKRNVNTVFQNYALFPHMTVEANIAYSLKIRHYVKSDIRDAVARALALVQLEGYDKRMPHELSGGQRQRVAIARAIVNKPKLLLLDEPLGALDLQLRRQMQIELKRLQKQLGITFVYITHDQEEALNMSSRVAVMRDGRFEQVGTPSEIYDMPRTNYVAGFVGNANIITGVAVETDSKTMLLSHPRGEVRALLRGADISAGQTATIAVRSEQIEIARFTGDSREGLTGTIKEKSFAAGMLRIAVEMHENSEIIVSRHGINSELDEGDRVILGWPPESAVIIGQEGGNG